METKEMKEH